MILQVDFSRIEYTRHLRGGGLLVITGQRQPNGGVRVTDIRYYPRIEALAA